MLTFLFSQFSSLQIFKSIFFRAGMGYLTTYFMVSWLLPWLIRRFKEKRLVSDFSSPDQKQQAVPIMGGALLIFASLISITLWGWVWQTPHILMLCATMVGFGLIGFFDDLSKITYKKKVDAGLIDRKNFLEKAEGLSENSRWLLEFAFTFIMLGVFFFAFQYLDTRIQIPFFPVKNFYPELPVWLYYIFAAALVVIGANSINMTDGLDSLATVPMLTCLLFVAAIAYISGDLEWSTKLKIPYLSNEIKEIAVWACVIMGGLMAFLKYNCPPASIYMGDVGSLGIGAALVTSFIFVKAEIYLSIAGGIFFIAGLSSLIQRLFFKFTMKKHGRSYAEQNRFFYRAPYHHHKQATYNSEGLQINSVYQKFVNRLRWFGDKNSVDKPTTKDGINSKIVWHNLIKAIWLLVLALIIFFKMR